MHPKTSYVVPPAAIELDNTSVAASGATLLFPVSARVEAGTIAVVRGENGSGKTTLLRVLAGHAAPSEGFVRVHGEIPRERDPRFRRRVASQIGLPPMAADLTVFDHMLLVSVTWQPTRQDALRAAQAVLDELQLTSLAKRFPGELSSGQTQLFGLALALVRPFDVLLLDEPEQRLDPGRVELLAHALLARRARGCTVVVATHSDLLSELVAEQKICLEMAES